MTRSTSKKKTCHGFELRVGELAAKADYYEVEAAISRLHANYADAMWYDHMASSFRAEARELEDNR